MKRLKLLMCIFVATLAGHGGALALDKVVFAQSSEASFTQLPILVARGLKLFDAHGIQPEFITVKNSATLIAGLASGDVNVSFTTATAAIKARDKKQDVRIFASIISEVNSSLVIQGDIAAKAGLNERSTLEERLKVLKGLRLAISAGSSNEFILRHLIDHAGLLPDRDVTLVPIGADAMVPAFANKRVDGFIMASPVTDTAINAHHGQALVDLMKGQYPPLKGMLYAVLVSSDNWLNANPRLAAGVVRAIWDAQQILDKEPAKARLAVQQYFGGLEPSVFIAAFNATQSATDSSPRIDLEGITKNYEFIKYSEKVTIAVPPADSFTNRFVDTAAEMK